MDKFFKGDERDVAMFLLINECGNTLPYCENYTHTELEHIRFAVAKLSNGDITQIKSAIQMAQANWRDLLICAEFANNVNAHNVWASTIV